MRFALMIEPQTGVSYGDQVAIAKRAEANGFEALFRSDHYTSFPGPAGRPTTDAWTVLAGLARETDRIGLAGEPGDDRPGIGRGLAGRSREARVVVGAEQGLEAVRLGSLGDRDLVAVAEALLGFDHQRETHGPSPG